MNFRCYGTVTLQGSSTLNQPRHHVFTSRSHLPRYRMIPPEVWDVKYQV